MAVRIVLGLSALIWLPYGIFCFFQPGFLEGAAGVVSTTATGSTELRAMYGGLQAAIGALALMGALRESMQRTALLTLGFLTCGLGLARLTGLVLDDAMSAYTASGLIVEFGTVAVVVWLMNRSAAPVPA